jgi:hypothetical protein
MARHEGFEVADVSVHLFDDERVRKLARTVAVHELEEAMVVYVAVVLASWRDGRRVPAGDAVPLWLPPDRLAQPVEDLRAVGLLDKSGRIPSRTWAKWYEPVRERRDRNRDRWARYNAQRTGSTAELPRGSDAATAPSVPLRSSPIRSSRARGAKDGSQESREKTTTGGPVSLAEAMAATPFGAELLRSKGGSS